MELKQLQIFVSIWEHLNISRAAEEVHLTQPTVSSHLKTLEEELGVKLFNRTSKEITPTKAAKLIYPYAIEILRLNKQIIQTVDDFLGKEKGLLEIGASNIPGQYLLPSLLGEFKKDRPKIEIRLLISDTSKIVEDVFLNKIELGLVGAKVVKDHLLFHELFYDELIFIVASSHHLSKKKEIALKDILDEPMIIREYGSGTRMTIEKKLAEEKVSIKDFRIVLEAGSTEAVRQAVKAGVGCAIISKRAVKDDIDCKRLFALKIKDFSITRKFYLVTHKTRILSPIAEAFIEFLKLKSKESTI